MRFASPRLLLPERRAHPPLPWARASTDFSGTVCDTVFPRAHSSMSLFGGLFGKKKEGGAPPPPTGPHAARTRAEWRGKHCARRDREGEGAD